MIVVPLSRGGPVRRSRATWMSAHHRASRAPTQELLRDFIVGATTRGGADAALLAEQLSVSRTRAVTLLSETRGGRAAEAARGRRVVVPVRQVEPAEAEAAWTRFTQWSRWRRAGGPTRAEHVEARAAAATRALADGDFVRLGDLLRDPVLDPNAVRRRVPPRDRDRLAATLLYLRADAAMQTGRAGEALAWARRALAVTRDHLEIAQILDTVGPALRMCRERPPAEAVAAFDAALAACARAGGGAGRARRRHVHANAVAPLLVAAAPADALVHAVRSRDLLEHHDAAFVEASLRLAQALATLGRLDEARAALAAARAVPAPPRYLAGWMARIEPSFLGEAMAAADWSAALAAAWAANEGYAFQLLLIAARIAAAPWRFDEGAWPEPALAGLRRVIAAAHRSRHGRRPTECATCRPVRLAWRAGHALGVGPGALPSWYAT
jgi:tetratricopeptide (TPR) repeat protein